MHWIPLVPYLHILFYICLTLIAVNTWQNESLSLPGNESPADRIYLPVLSLHIVWPQELSPVLPCKRSLVQECFRTGLPVVYIKNWNIQFNNMLTDKNNTFSLWVCGESGLKRLQMNYDQTNIAFYNVSFYLTQDKRWLCPSIVFKIVEDLISFHTKVVQTRIHDQSDRSPHLKYENDIKNFTITVWRWQSIAATEKLKYLT